MDRTPGRMKRRTQVLRGLLVAFLALFSGAALAVEPVRIGFISTLSGPNAAPGVDIRDAFQLAIQLQGGTLGGRPAEVLIADDQLNPETGVQAAERLIKRDHVNLVTGIVYSNVLLAVLPRVFGAQLTYISPNAGPTQLTSEQCNRAFFSTSWQNDVNNAVPGLLASQRGFDRVVLIAPNYQAGRDALAGFKSRYSGQILGEIYSKLGQLDYAAEIAQIRAAHPPAVFFFLPGGMGVNFIKQFVASGLSQETTLLTASVGADEDMIRAVGEPMLGLFNGSHWGLDLQNEANRRFVTAFEKAYGRLPSVYASQGYDAANLIAAALRDTGGATDDREALIRALRAKRFDSVRGDFRWDNNNFPIQDWYLRVVARDSQGRIANKIIGEVARQLSDPNAAKCPLRW